MEIKKTEYILEFLKIIAYRSYKFFAGIAHSIVHDPLFSFIVSLASSLFWCMLTALAVYINLKYISCIFSLIFLGCFLILVLSAVSCICRFLIYMYKLSKEIVIRWYCEIDHEISINLTKKHLKLQQK